MGCGNGRDQRTHSQVRARRYPYEMRPYTEEPGEGKLSCTVLDWRWGGQPPRRPYGKKRPLGMPVWSDKLLAEVMRMILDAYFDGTFSDHSHGFRTDRGCHTALREIYRTWTGTAWIIEGDIADCFGSLDHNLIISALAEHIQDGRFLNLVKQLLDAGYMDNWTFNQTLSGVPQGSLCKALHNEPYAK